MKYLKKFQTNADYQAFKNSSDWVTPNISVIKEKVSGNDFNIVFEPFCQSSGGGNNEVTAPLITFYIMSKMISPIEYSEYTAVEGMTWGEWLSSEYNVNNYTSGEGHVWTPDAIALIGIRGTSARITDVIIAGQKYDIV